ncbi:MAG TPA: hypothetical protein VLS25_01920, partial [Dehalococcoidia bacterium]|nr:hypothetical protein [Dehalococcoidia bacterium]
MRKAWTLLVLSVLIAGTGILVSVQDAAASFHIMRVYGVMGSATGDPNIQYVELRMADPGQNFLSSGSLGTTVLCLFDASGAPYARFKFPSDVANGADEASILTGTAEFDTNWAAGSPDFTFSAANTTAIAGGADVLHPVRSPAGKVAFGTDGATMAAAMCGASFSVIDSVAYGSAYSGAVNFGTKFGSDLPTTGIQNLKVQGPAPVNPANGTLCYPGSLASNCSVARDNSVDYALVSTNNAGNQPRNNANQTGPVALLDADGDGVGDAVDLCPGTAPAAPVDANGCSQAQVDSDADGACNPGAPSGGPGPCTGTDNCPTTPNPGQGNVDGDALGDACDPDADNDGYDNNAEASTPVCSGTVNDDNGDDGAVNDGCPAVGAAESVCSGSADDDGDGFPNDGCPQVGAFSEAQFKIGTNQLGSCSTGVEAGPSPSWPSDFVSGGIPNSTDKITVTDLTSFIAPVRRLDTSPGNPNFNSRWDLIPGRGLFPNMIVVND